MPKFKISNEYISKCNDTEISEYPKYTTQVINLANQNAGGTRPRNVGQLSELLPEYLSSPGEASLLAGKNGIMRDISTLLIMQLIGFGIKLTILEIVWITLTSIFYQWIFKYLFTSAHFIP